MTKNEETQLNNLLAKKRKEQRILKEIKSDKSLIDRLATEAWFVRTFDEIRNKVVEDETGNDLTGE